MAASFSLRDKWGLGAAAGVALCLGMGGWAVSSRNSVRADSNAPMRPHAAAKAATLVPMATAAATIPAELAAPTSEKIVVHVAGCVKNPGVYSLHPGDRLNDAVKAAGGFKINAQQDALNLADTVCDADQIFIPSKASATSAASAKVSQSQADDAMFAPSARAPRHPLIVRGTPVRVALAQTAPAYSSAPEAAETADLTLAAAATTETQGDETAPPSCRRAARTSRPRFGQARARCGRGR